MWLARHNLTTGTDFFTTSAAPRLAILEGRFTFKNRSKNKLRSSSLSADVCFNKNQETDSTSFWGGGIVQTSADEGELTSRDLPSRRRTPVQTPAESVEELENQSGFSERARETQYLQRRCLRAAHVCGQKLAYVKENSENEVFSEWLKNKKKICGSS